MTDSANRMALIEERILRANCDPCGQVCPKCGKHIITPDSKAGRVYGVCDVCHQKALNDTKREMLALRQAQTEGDKLRQALRRAPSVKGTLEFEERYYA